MLSLGVLFTARLQTEPSFDYIDWERVVASGLWTDHKLLANLFCVHEVNGVCTPTTERPKSSLTHFMVRVYMRPSNI